MSGRPGREIRPADRLIVALDVPTADEALAIVDQLDGLVGFYKVGLELLMAGGMQQLLRTLGEKHRVFVDLKLPNDIPETVKRAVNVAAAQGVKFLTLSNGVSAVTMAAAVAGRGSLPGPELLFVPFLSAMDRAEFTAQCGRRPEEFEAVLAERTQAAKAAGADGFIVSGQEIALLRKQYPDAVLVSPGIRPAGAASDDHKRSCTPAEAVQLGADYIVVGRPIRDAKDRRAAVKSIVDELAGAS